MKKVLFGLSAGFLLLCLFVFQISAADANFSLSSENAYPGSEVKIVLSIDTGKTAVTTVGLSELTYDRTKLRFVGFGDYGTIVTKSMIGSLGCDDEKGIIIFGYSTPKTMNDTVCVLNFSVLDTAAAETIEIGMTAKVKNGSADIGSFVSSGSVSILKRINEETEDEPDDEIPHIVSGEPSSAETEKLSVWHNPFSDVSEKAEYYEAVRFVFEEGLMIGTSDTEFSPDMTMTRAMFVTILGRMEKIAADKYSGSVFSDVPAEKWFSPYVIWASETGLILGYGDGTFGPEDEITMEQAAMILARYAEHCGKKITLGAELDRYPDGADVSDWAVSAMRWALENRIYVMNGKRLSPKKPAERCVLAEMLYVFKTTAK